MIQLDLNLIKHEVAGALIEQRGKDGYINASQLCNVAGRPWHQYISPEGTGNFIRALSESTGLNRAELILELPAGETVDYWVHPQLAIHLAQWLSPKFAVSVSEWVLKWSTDFKPSYTRAANLPYHVERYMLNSGQVPAGYFSVLQEMTFILIAPLERYGYVIPERMLPDISMGRFLCKHLRDLLGVDTDSLPVYIHIFPDGRRVEAKIYPEEYLAEFRKLIRQEWIPKHATKYFIERDSTALPYLHKALSITAEPMKPSRITKKKVA